MRPLRQTAGKAPTYTDDAPDRGIQHERIHSKAFWVCAVLFDVAPVGSGGCAVIARYMCVERNGFHIFPHPGYGGFTRLGGMAPGVDSEARMETIITKTVSPRP